MKQSRLISKWKDQENTIQTWETEHLEIEGSLGAALIERWGMVCGEADGEDGALRQKFRLQTPEELVDRAFDVAKLFMERARLEGLIHTTPDLPQPDGIVVGGELEEDTRTDLDTSS